MMFNKQFITKLTISIVALFFIASVPVMAHGNMVIEFSGMSPHLNQTLYLRAIDKGTLKEVGRTSMQISASSFDLILPIADPGRSYFIDFFADLNSNGLYDVPPADHAWRLELNNATGSGDTISFSHNASFTDINWVYELTVSLTNMTPHLGQLIELRVEDNLNNQEVGRIKIASIPSANFDVKIPGIKFNREYNIEFYADLNGNGLYDSPPTDHAWKISFTNNSGNFTANFTHNATFTDINWKYLLTIDFSLMTPHVGQLFELRVVRQDNQEEIGRFSLPQILVPDFTIYIPEFELDHNYNVDFYADLNGNGSYNAPPIDHAWRLPFISSSGDFTINFSHNANFTNINWPNPTGVEDEILNNPSTYNLYQNYPNPFNPTTSIKFSLPKNDFISIKLYNLIGQEIETLFEGMKEKGTHTLILNAKDLPSGVYLYKLEAESFTEIKKMVLLK